MIIRNLNELFVHELTDLYDAEHQLLKALPKMVTATTFADLKTALAEHFNQTKAQVKRLEQAFHLTGQKPSRRPCAAMRGILDEADGVLDEALGGAIRDAAIIGAIQRIEHYEMAGYGRARTYAYMLGYTQVAQLLQETLDEEEQADKRLTQIANSINALAME